MSVTAALMQLCFVNIYSCKKCTLYSYLCCCIGTKLAFEQHRMGYWVILERFMNSGGSHMGELIVA